MAECKEELKNILTRVKEKIERASLELNIEKTKIMATVTSWQTEGEKVEAVIDFSFLAPKSLWMVTEAMKSEDNCFWAEKQWQT